MQTNGQKVDLPTETIPRSVRPSTPGRGPLVEVALLALLVGLAGLAAAMLAWQSLTPDPVRFAGVIIDRLSAVLTLLVAGVGAVTYRFAQRYLQGENGRRRFLHWLAFSVGSAYLLMLSSNLVLLLLAWSLTSMGLHALLTHYRERAEAWRPARKKFLISRLGDIALVVAILLIWRRWDTLDLHVFLERVAAFPDSATAVAVAILIVLAALTKSAQFPFHSWLPETMEAPTPVSALMHAGIINAGGALLLRFAPLLVQVPVALFLLALVGTLTIVLGMLTMWAQVKIKRTLAWSTVSQMGFMMVQCGLAAFPAALLHIVGHGCYKACSFLRSGQVPLPVSATARSPGRTLMLAVLGAGLGAPAIVLASEGTGFDMLHSPGELALSALVTLSLGQFWVAALGVPTSSVLGLSRLAGASLGTVAIPFIAFALYQGAAAFLAPVLGELPTQTGPLAWAAAMLPVLGLTALTLTQAMLPVLARTPRGRAWYVHALQGFYFGALADEVVDRIWGRWLTKGKEVTRA